MWEQRSSSSRFQIFARDSKSIGIDHHHSQASKSTSDGADSGDKGRFASGLRDGLASGFGFKFDVANFDINAVSPTSW